MTTSNFLRSHFNEAKSEPFSFITANYKDFGINVITALMFIYFSSTLNKSVWISFDKVKNNLLIDANVHLLIPISVDMGNLGTCNLSLGTKFYIKEGPDGIPTSGRITITTSSLG